MFTIKWTNLFSVAYQNISKYPCYWQVNKDIRMQLFTFSKCIQTMNNWCNNTKSENEKYFNKCRINSESCDKTFAKICFRQGFTLLYMIQSSNIKKQSNSLFDLTLTFSSIRLTITNLDNLRNFPTKKPDFFRISALVCSLETTLQNYSSKH